MIKTLTVLNAQSIHVIWIAPTQPNGIITSYNIAYITDSGSNNVVVPFNGEMVSSMTTKCTVYIHVCNFIRHNLMILLDWLHIS